MWFHRRGGYRSPYVRSLSGGQWFLSVPLRRLSKPPRRTRVGIGDGPRGMPRGLRLLLPGLRSARHGYPLRRRHRTPEPGLVRCNGQRVASRPRGMSRPRIVMEEPLAFRPTRWGQGLRADDSVPMGGRLAVGLVLSTGFGRGRRGAWVRRALREDGPAAVSGRHNERSLPVTGGFAAVAAFAFLRLFLAAAEQWLGDQGFGLVRPLAFLCHGIGPRR